MPIDRLASAIDRERRTMLAHLSEVNGLLPLLMKPRNGQPWSVEDRRELSERMRRFSRLSPYLALLVLPGGLIMLPALAWWLDRRRRPRALAEERGIGGDGPRGVPQEPAGSASPTKIDPA